MATLELKATAMVHSTFKFLPLRDLLILQTSYPAKYFDGNRTERQQSIWQA
jgi:hypothetical protein